MKKLFNIILLMVPLFLSAQTKLNQKDCIKKNTIDFTKEYIYFEIYGLIEIDGHTFLNDTCKCPIIFKADLNGIEIFNKCTNEKYTRRICNKKGCDIIHLEKEKAIRFEYNYPWQTIPNEEGIYLNTLPYIIQDTLNLTY